MINYKIVGEQLDDMPTSIEAPSFKEAWDKIRKFNITTRIDYIVEGVDAQNQPTLACIKEGKVGDAEMLHDAWLYSQTIEIKHLDILALAEKYEDFAPDEDLRDLKDLTFGAYEFAYFIAWTNSNFGDIERRFEERFPEAHYDTEWLVRNLVMPKVCKIYEVEMQMLGLSPDFEATQNDFTLMLSQFVAKHYNLQGQFNVCIPGKNLMDTPTWA